MRVQATAGMTAEPSANQNSQPAARSAIVAAWEKFINKSKKYAAHDEQNKHKVGDVVSIRSPRLGTLTNRVNHCNRIAPWTFGVSALMRNLAARGLLA